MQTKNRSSNSKKSISNAFLNSYSSRCYSSFGGGHSHGSGPVGGKGVPPKLSIPGIKHIVAVSSAKGGVGKSTMSVNLALALSSLKGLDLSVGILDADVFGPSLPIMMNLNDVQPAIEESTKKMIPLQNYGRVPLSGAVIVSTPQDVALADVVRGVKMFQKVQVPVSYGIIIFRDNSIVENMSHFECPNCHHKSHIFGDGGAKKTAERLGINILGEVPLNLKIRELSDSGRPITVTSPDSEQSKVFNNNSNNNNNSSDKYKLDIHKSYKLDHYNHHKRSKKIEINNNDNEEYLKIDWGLNKSKKNVGGGSGVGGDHQVEEIELVHGEWGDKFVVINKPAGYPVQSNENQSIEKMMIERMRREMLELQALNDSASADEPLKGRPKRRLKTLVKLFDNNHPKGILLYFINRLDKWTSGLLVVAITSPVCAQMSQTMHKWHKSYRLITDTPSCLNNSNNNNNNNNNNCCFISPFIKGNPPIFDVSGKVNGNGTIQSYIGPRIHPVPLFKRDSNSNDNGDGNQYKCKECNERGIVREVGHPFLSSFLLFGSSPEKGKNKFEARNAETEYKLLSISKEHRKAMFEASLITGRTHQLRIHFSESGFPIVGDPYYNHYFIDQLLDKNQQILCENTQQQQQSTSSSSSSSSSDDQENEMMLQAYKLTFIHPTTLSPLTLTIDPPKSWNNIINKLKI
ncbi:Mrp/NBP35 family protein [Heterostelium album PN500]|uniref:Mrp/NBP35 family protein n=1 Tax=Heterostelium pallidum (strain ATCC 26659 / Pp 5 / PN500) TaxID=670386 RepID=D3AY73_HETP5|nr:Mrp/NBP35 family protein [Heterostelium album PN500]EFA85900.1 Mrp/NBP35 family protein [Heterostelium album PN500]|eukprot:XP_020438006.1 Mrp/NBP35 family protein [Heterostelium album PN500]